MMKWSVESKMKRLKFLLFTAFVVCGIGYSISAEATDGVEEQDAGWVPVSNVEGVVQEKKRTFGPTPESSLPYEGDNGGVSDNQGIPSLSPRLIIGSDQRGIVSNTTAWPYRATVRIKAEYPTYTAYGSGSMISSDVVVSCGHLLYDRSAKRWASKVTVYPAYNAGKEYYSNSTSKELVTYMGYINNGSTTEDVGLIKLSKKIGNETGWLGYNTGVNTTSSYRITGYDGDKGGRMVTRTGTLFNIQSNYFRYTMDTTGGASGSSVVNSSGQIVGIHSGGVYSNGVPQYNHAARMTSTIVKDIENLKKK